MSGATMKVFNKPNEATKGEKKKKRITTVPQFDSTKKLMEQNKKIVSLVSNK